jgi:hypothetical protein
MTDGVGQPRGTTSTVPRRFVLAMLAAACAARAARPNSPPLPDCLDSPIRHPQDCLAMPVSDCFVAVVARLDGGSGDRVLGRQRR